MSKKAWVPDRIPNKVLSESGSIVQRRHMGDENHAGKRRIIDIQSWNRPICESHRRKESLACPRSSSEDTGNGKEGNFHSLKHTNNGHTLLATPFGTPSRMVVWPLKRATKVTVGEGKDEDTSRHEASSKEEKMFCQSVRGASFDFDGLFLPRWKPQPRSRGKHAWTRSDASIPRTTTMVCVVWPVWSTYYILSNLCLLSEGAREVQKLVKQIKEKERRSANWPCRNRQRFPHCRDVDTLQSKKMKARRDDFFDFHRATWLPHFWTIDSILQAIAMSSFDWMGGMIFDTTTTPNKPSGQFLPVQGRKFSTIIAIWLADKKENLSTASMVLYVYVLSVGILVVCMS